MKKGKKPAGKMPSFILDNMKKGKDKGAKMPKVVPGKGMKKGGSCARGK